MGSAWRHPHANLVATKRRSRLPERLARGDAPDNCPWRAGRAARRLGSLAQVLEEALATTLADDEEWSTGLLPRCLSTDAAGRPALVAGSRVVVLDYNTLRPVTDTRLPNTGSSTWASQNGQSRVVATSSDRLYIADW